MNFIKKHISLFRGFTGVFTVLFLVVVILQFYMTNEYRSKVDELLGTNSGSVEHSSKLSDYTYQSEYKSAEDLMDAEAALVEQVEEEGAVLLKGTADDIVVGGDRNVTLFGIRSGRLQYNSVIGGVTNTSLAVSLDQAMEERGFGVNPTMVDFYKGISGNYDTTSTTAANEVPISEYTSADYAGYEDAGIIVLGRTCSEAYTFLPGSKGLENPAEFSRSATGNILSLSDNEKDLISHVEGQGFSKVIVLLNTSSAMEIEELKQDENIDAILLMGNPGAYGTYGIADILKGDVVPSGHLTDTYAVNTAKSPAAQNFGEYSYANAEDTYSAWYLAEGEGIYTGYKYYETRFYDSVMEQGNASAAAHQETADGGSEWNYDHEVTYPFGYGIEGSVFLEEITDTQIDWSGETDSTVTVKVTNTGDTEAKHVVQLYVSAPYTEYDRENGLEKSAVQLIAYAKTGEAEAESYEDTTLLKPGASEEVTLTFNTKDFSSYDPQYEHDGTAGAYRLEAGSYYFATGNGAHDAVCAVIKKQDETKLPEIQVTGAAFAQDLGEDIAWTRGTDGETLIENQLEDMDIAYEEYGDAFTGKGAGYLTRSDWAGTFPQPVEGVEANDVMLAPLNCETYDSKAANAEYSGTVYTEADFGIKEQTGEYTVQEMAGVTDYEDEIFEKLLNEIPLEYYSSYVSGNNQAIPEISLEHANAADSPVGMIVGYGLYNDARPPYAVEAGDDSVRGVAPSVYTGEPVLAASYSHLLARLEGNLVGNDGLWTGAYWWFGPGANLHRTPYNARNNEYFSEDPVLTGWMTADMTVAAQEKGIVVCAKHYAFNDQELNRTGVGVFTTEQAARENELRGFEFAFLRGGMKSVMTGFNRAGCTFSSAHEGLIRGICRGEWGFNGLIITDSVKDPNYMRVAECLTAGTDFMLGGNGNTTGAWENVSPEKLMEDPVLVDAARTAMHHYLYTFADSALVDGYTAGASATGATWWESCLIAGNCIFGVLMILSGVLWIISYTSERRKEHA